MDRDFSYALYGDIFKALFRAVDDNVYSVLGKGVKLFQNGAIFGHGGEKYAFPIKLWGVQKEIVRRDNTSKGQAIVNGIANKIISFNFSAISILFILSF